MAWGAFSVSTKVESGSGIVVDNTILVAGDAGIDIGNSSSGRTIEGNLRSNDNHLDCRMSTDPLIGIGKGFYVFQTDTFAVSMNVETIIPSVLRGEVADNDMGAGDRDTADSRFRW